MTMKEFNLEDLRKPLEISQIEFKPGTIFDYGGPKCVVLAYKDARVDMDRLDDVVGAENWQDRFTRDEKGCLQCQIGIFVNGQWIWKGDTGVPSDFDSQKGEFSDARKRAGFAWGIGRELYDFESVIVDLLPEEVYTKDGKLVATKKLNMRLWKWERKDGQLIAHKGNQKRYPKGGDAKTNTPTRNTTQTTTPPKGKPAPTANQWEKICEKVRAKEITLDGIKEHYTLSPIQEELVKKIINK